MVENDVPRRCKVELMTPTELAIRQAKLAVEEMPADVLLTEATNLLSQAGDKVADFVDKQAAVSEVAEENLYFVEVDSNGCSKCGAGRTWIVVAPDGLGGPTSYRQEEDARERAEDLNIAFARGKQR
jgi:hypothetical protein